MPSPALIWFRRDLRLGDNPAWFSAVASQRPLIAVYIWAPDEEQPWAPGAASRWWLHHSLAALDQSLSKQGIALVLREGSSLRHLLSLAEESGAASIYWNELPEPGFDARDVAIAKALRARGMQVEISGDAHLLHNPLRGLNGQGKPYQVFTPFYKARLADGIPDSPYPMPKRVQGFDKPMSSSKLNALKLLPRLDWDAGLRKTWTPGETGAAAKLKLFLQGGASAYDRDRDFPARDGISGLSPHLHFGEIGPRALWHAANGARATAWIRQFWWREFAHHLLRHFPHTPEKPLRPAYANFPWRKDAKALKAWQQGRTGYPLVDAGMRELWATGFMHNRVRMVAASFLVKHLLLPWQAGAAWFWDTLVDADLANNTLGWQWVAGSGADAAPYFRIFHPVTQSQRFDETGDYIRRWLPELKRLSPRDIHQPFAAAPLVLAEAGIALGRDYPPPLVEHAPARERALAALRLMQEAKQDSNANE